LTPAEILDLCRTALLSHTGEHTKEHVSIDADAWRAAVAALNGEVAELPYRFLWDPMRREWVRVER
jgi:hypothetical protein